MYYTFLISNHLEKTQYIALILSHLIGTCLHRWLIEVRKTCNEKKKQNINCLICDKNIQRRQVDTLQNGYLLYYILISVSEPKKST